MKVIADTCGFSDLKTLGFEGMSALKMSLLVVACSIAL